MSKQPAATNQDSPRQVNSPRQRVLWHTVPQDQLLLDLQTTTAGLSSEEAATRLSHYGPNELQEKLKPTLLVRFFEQFKSLLVLILLAAIIISLFLGEWVDAAVIGAIVILNAILGLAQEARAEQALAALKRMSLPFAQVVRGDQVEEAPTRLLVPGDLILVAAGSKVPADARLLEAANLQADEAALTGESVPVEKELTLLSAQAPLAERRNMIYTGTTITYGRGTAVVVTTGMETEIGRIARLLEEGKKESTPLQRNLEQVGKVLALLVGLVCLVVFLTGWLQGIPLLTMFLLSVSLAVAAIPEGLPAIVTIVLALGTQRMAKRGAIIRHLPAVETLGSTSVICSDKTGTLTLNEMMVERIFTPTAAYEVSGAGYQPSGAIHLDDRPVETIPPSLAKLLLAATMNTDAALTQKEEQWEIHGDPTEAALIVLAAKSGIWKESVKTGAQRIAEVPFSSDRKRMTTAFAFPETIEVFSKGAPDILLDLCTAVWEDGQSLPLRSTMRQAIQTRNEEYAREGLRVLAIAGKTLPLHSCPEPKTLEDNLVFYGLAAMRDPARSEAREAIETCRRAGIKPVMITGDHLLTATAIGGQLRLLEGENQALTGAELAALTDEELAKRAPNLSVYARVSPEDKVRIMETYQKLGHVVAMTGDGVNDAPALKRADIGIAMGITGTDVTKETADMILTDDNFATIVSAVEEGRTIFTNIKKFLAFLLSCNMAEVLAVFLGFLLFPKMGPLLTAPQILWMNLVTDGFPALALGMDPPEKDVMGRPPRSRTQGVFTRPLFLRIGVAAAIMAAGALLAFLWGAQAGVGKAETMAFTTIVSLELLFAFLSRSERIPTWKMKLFENRYLLWACLLSFLLQLVLIYFPPLQGAFSTVPLGWLDWGITAVILLVSGLLMEGLKVTLFSRLSS
ncbi:MAG: cation-translocating P-type ATPase [bacterium]